MLTSATVRSGVVWFDANRYWDSVRVKNNRSDLFLVKLGTEDIMPEAEFASSNATKRVHDVLRFYAWTVVENELCLILTKVLLDTLLQ